MKKYLNESLPKEQRLGQIGMSNGYGEMKIVEYRNHKDIDVYFKEYDQIVRHKAYSNFLIGKIGVKFNNKRLGEIEVNTKGEEMIISEYNNANDIIITFLHNWIDVKTNYNDFKRKLIKNPLYYKEQREGQIRRATNGQLMRLLIWNDAFNCIAEFEDGTLVDCGYSEFNSGSVANPNYVKPSENKFYYNNKLNCWVGVTKKDEEFLFSHPDKRVVEYVKSCTWHINMFGYVANSKTKLLHKLILKIPNKFKNIYNMIDHINNNPLDNRYENLRWSNSNENSKNRKSNSKSGITGLRKYNNTNWHGNCCKINTKYYEDKNEALIDLLILQKYFKVTHNEHLFYILDNVSQERIDFVENYIKEKIEKQKDTKYKTTCKNTFEKIDNDTYRMYDSKGRWCLVDAEDIEKIKLSNWIGVYSATKKIYFSSNVNNKTIILHRFLLNLTNEEYSNFIVDHISGDEANNKKSNLIITDITGNNINIIGKGYHIDKRNGSSYKAYIRVDGNTCNRTFYKEQEAINFYNYYKQILLNGRLQLKTKEELDEWLGNIEKQGLNIDDAIKQHYEKLYRHVRELIKKEYPKKARRKKIA